jgi:glycosyltransferase involved in cell wall biosynthesis
MRIAQISPLYESVPPKWYGGTERVVSYLTEELVRQGHEVTLFASGDSVTEAELVPQSRRSLRLDAACNDAVPLHMRMVDHVFRRADEFDVLHFHIDCLHFPLSARYAHAGVSTLHGRLDLEHITECYRSFRDLPFVSISQAQRHPMPWLNWAGTVHHGLPEDLHQFVAKPGDYLAFLGRISPEKRADLAIEIARRAGLPIKIAAKVGRDDVDYYEQVIVPLLRQSHVEFLGEIGDADKQELLGNARALVFPIDWPEPFGLVMIEAMACGTPVIAFPSGSVSEVIDDGINGALVRSVEEAVQAVDGLSSLSRQECREQFEQRFTAARMARDYVALFQEVIDQADELTADAEITTVRYA